jgi:alpha-D-ribose 1-methylphosphonate 5-triphosphate diphosphatase PhnM
MSVPHEKKRRHWHAKMRKTAISKRYTSPEMTQKRHEEHFDLKAKVVGPSCKANGTAIASHQDATELVSTSSEAI